MDAHAWDSMQSSLQVLHLSNGILDVAIGSDGTIYYSCIGVLVDRAGIVSDALALCALLTLLGGLLLAVWRAQRIHRRIPVEPLHFCAQCYYPITAPEATACPECGTMLGRSGRISRGHALGKLCVRAAVRNCWAPLSVSLALYVLRPERLLPASLRWVGWDRFPTTGQPYVRSARCAPFGRSVHAIAPESTGGSVLFVDIAGGSADRLYLSADRETLVYLVDSNGRYQLRAHRRGAVVTSAVVAECQDPSAATSESLRILGFNCRNSVVVLVNEPATLALRLLEWDPASNSMSVSRSIPSSLNLAQVSDAGNALYGPTVASGLLGHIILYTEPTDRPSVVLDACTLQPTQVAVNDGVAYAGVGCAVSLNEGSLAVYDSASTRERRIPLPIDCTRDMVVAVDVDAAMEHVALLLEGNVLILGSLPGGVWTDRLDARSIGSPLFHIAVAPGGRLAVAWGDEVIVCVRSP